MKKYIRYIVLIVSLFLIFSISRSIWGLLQKGKTLDEAKERVEELEKEQAKLLEMREVIESEEFVEREAREKLGLAKPGEVVVILPHDDILRKFAPKVEEEEFVQEQPIWKRWVRMFFWLRQ